MTRMLRISIMASLASVAFLSEPSFAATSTKADGGSIQTKLSANIILNDESTMRREWVAIHDSAIPVGFVGTPGVTTIYESGGRYSSGNYRYRTVYSIRVSEPVVAIDIRFITFDVWGERTRTLRATEVRDLSSGDHQLDAVWNLFSENEASEHYASIAYVAAVRTQKGEIHRADVSAVTDAARKYMSDFTSDLLDEDPPESN